MLPPNGSMFSNDWKGGFQSLETRLPMVGSFGDPPQPIAFPFGQRPLVPERCSPTRSLSLHREGVLLWLKIRD